MPFIAIDNTGNRIDITRIENPRMTIDPKNVFCQLCQQPMMIRSGLIRSAHFAHRSVCTSEYDHHPESQDHLLGKQYVYEYLRSLDEYSDCEFQFEYKIESGKRIADLMMISPTGFMVANEIQLAQITTEKIKERTLTYYEQGIDVWWWLGKSAYTAANTNFCIRTTGHCYLITFTVETGLLSLRQWEKEDSEFPDEG